MKYAQHWYDARKQRMRKERIELLWEIGWIMLLTFAIAAGVYLVGTAQ